MSNKLRQINNDVLFFEHHAKVIAIYAVEPPQYCRTLIFIYDIISSTDFFLDGACFDDPTAEGTCLLSFALQRIYPANDHEKTML
jgi:hypothetical protein